MRLRAIRLAEIGRFSEPVAVEGLVDGLNVLAGPNEHGKSTLLAALRLALFEKHTSRHRQIEALRPYSGGTPTIEIDFDAGGSRWSLRKRFLASAGAELRSLDGNRIYRGADAETALAAQLGDIGRYGLLWVGQKAALAPFDPSGIPGAADSLKTVLAREVETVASGSLAKSVQSEVVRRLDQFLTAKTRRPRGDYDAALKARDARQKEAQDAQAAYALAARNLETLAELRSRQSALANPAAVAARTRAVETTHAALEAARAAVQNRNLAAAALKTAQAELAERKSAAETLARHLAEIQATSTRETAAHEQVARIEAQLATLAETIADLRAGLGQHAERLAALERALAAARAGEHRRVARTRLDELQRRAEDASAAAAICDVATAALARIAATPSLVHAATREAGEIRVLQSGLAAAAPTITFDCPGVGAANVLVDGEPLGGRQRLTAVTAMTIEIAGIGRITVEPGGDDTIARMRADLEARRNELARLLAAAGAPDVASLEAEDRRRGELEVQRSNASARLTALAPAGIEQLIAAVDSCRAEIAGAAADEDWAGPPSGAVETEIQRHKEQAAALEAELRVSLEADGAARQELAAARAHRDAARDRRRVLEAAAPAPYARAARSAALDSAVADAEARLHQAALQHATWDKEAPDGQAMQRLQDDHAAADTARRAAERQINDAEVEAARLDGELAAARAEDIESRMHRAEAAAADAAERATELGWTVAALQMLGSEIAHEVTASREHFLAPVLARLDPMLARVLPGARAVLGDRLAADGLTRDGRNEAIGRLSDGTQEQIAILVRLAFARLFADAGVCVPLILDDALVYSDDARIGHMFRDLESSAKHHQIIVFTCRSRTFESLEGTRLRLVPWQPRQPDAALRIAPRP